MRGVKEARAKPKTPQTNHFDNQNQNCQKFSAPVKVWGGPPPSPPSPQAPVRANAQKLGEVGGAPAPANALKLGEVGGTFCRGNTKPKLHQTKAVQHRSHGRTGTR